MSTSKIPQYDVIIIGAGLSGIGAAYHIQNKCPNHRYAILEGRGAIGGTWDLFRYPGIRSDSDMYTLGFSFNPWKNPKSIADGPAILTYIKETAKKFGIDKKIKFNHKVAEADWSSADKKWTIRVAAHKGGESQIIQCNFLFSCSGYYDYEQGYSPEFEGSETFKGTIIHPQKWDENLPYAGKKVVVIGSGATAVTLVPEMAKKAEQVVMLQRSPSYIINMPSEDKVANVLKKILPSKAAHRMIRWKNILIANWFYGISRKKPEKVKAYFRLEIRKALGREYDMTHFTPKYKPWDQRVCIIPDGDLFEAIKSGKAVMETDTITRFTPDGILLDSGKELEADIIVTATGLNLQLLGGMKLKKDGKEVVVNSLHCYKGVMFSDIPNFAVAVGYTNASWTLKCDLNCTFVTRVLNHLDKNGYRSCTPRFDPEEFATEPLLDLNSSYIRRSLDIFPKQGSAAPWKVYQNYIKDLRILKFGSVNDKYLEYRE